IREVLADDEQKIIRTIHGCGFAFAASAVGSESLERSDWQIVMGERHIVLGKGENIVGRGRDAEVRIDAPSVSRHHARITVSDGIVSVQDLGSKNGTTVNGRRVRAAPQALADGDQLTFGVILTSVVTVPPDSSTETARQSRPRLS